MPEDSTEALVLADQEGNYYVVPLDTLRGMRASDEQKSALADAYEGDVAGFAMVSKIDAITIKQKNTEDPIGSFLLLGVVRLPQR